MTPVISVDAMGGDDAPGVVFDGIDQFVQNHGDGFDFLLHGDQSVLTPLRAAMTHAGDRCQIVHCDSQITMDMKPSQALRIDSSMRRTVQAVHDGRALAAVSAGNTGALMGLSMTIYGSAPGVRRPALAGSWPSRGSYVTVLDVGASVQASARQLVEYAIMGQAFARAVHDRESPRIGLLNIGTEAAKGRPEVRQADMMIRSSGLEINYAGFMEGYEISTSAFDVAVTDGFTGNMISKACEGTLEVVRRLLRAGLSQQADLADVFNSDPSFVGLGKFLDTSNVNGGVFLGLNGLTVKSHGAANKYGFANAIRIAANAGNSNYAAEVNANMQQLQNIRDSQETRQT